MHPRALAALLLLLAFPSSVRADETVGRVDGVVVDGVVDEDLWSAARALPVTAVEAPALPPDDGTVTLEPRLRVVESDGRLCFALQLDEDPSETIGLILKIAPAGVTNAADALEVAFRPQSLRAAAFSVRGPKGVGRAHYPVEGRAVATKRGRWSIELAIWLKPIVGDDPSAHLRVGAAVLTRTPNLFASSPDGAVFHGPETWHTLAPDGGRWGDGAPPDVDAMETADATDRTRLVTWNAFLTSNLKLAGDFPLMGAAEDVVNVFRSELLDPLDRMAVLRADLLPGLLSIRGDILRQLGLVDEARNAFDQALEIAPGWREARMTRALTVELHRFTERPPDQPSDYAAMFAALDAVDAGDDPWLADAVVVARGFLWYRQGQFSEATRILAPMATRYPYSRLVVMTLEHARKETPRFAAERMAQKRDASRDLPRVRITTNRGPIVVELFQDQAPNAVNSFVWLAREAFFDGQAWHRNVPFFGLQTGDPFSKVGGDPGLVGLGGPGYEIPATGSDRPPHRGMLAFVKTASGVVGSQFMLLTGAAAHAASELLVFGRVLEGMDVADRLVENDRIEKVEVLRVREGWTYVPTDLAGRQPEHPVATAPPPPRRRR